MSAASVLLTLDFWLLSASFSCKQKVTVFFSGCALTSCSLWDLHSARRFHLNAQRRTTLCKRPALFSGLRCVRLAVRSFMCAAYVRMHVTPSLSSSSLYTCAALAACSRLLRCSVTHSLHPCNTPPGDRCYLGLKRKRPVPESSLRLLSLPPSVLQLCFPLFKELLVHL